MKTKDWLWLIITGLGLLLASLTFSFNVFAQKEYVVDKFGEVIKAIDNLGEKIDKLSQCGHNK